MVDLGEQENAAIRHALKMMAEVMEETGWETRFSDLSEAQVLTLVTVVIRGFQDAMISISQNARLPEVPF